jgi:hypothetical protein
MPLTNCIFRVGSAAALVTDVPRGRKYELVRTTAWTTRPSTQPLNEMNASTLWPAA